MTRRTRRQFLSDGIRAALALPLAETAGLLVSAIPSRARASGKVAGLMPEYGGTLDDVLVVYDQVRAGHLLREIVEILRHTPPASRLHVLVSRTLFAEAEERLSVHGISEVDFLVRDGESLSGDWGRDIFQVARDEDGVRTVHVPWNKSSATRSDLRRGVDNLLPLTQEDMRVRLLPAAFEGGNLMANRTPEGRRVLFAGSTIAVETRALYRRWHASAITSADVARILADSLGADEVVWIGSRDSRGRLARQPRLLFHVDMGMTLVATGTAVVAKLPSDAPWPADHRGLIVRELARTREALEERRRLGIPRDSLVVLPELGSAEDAYVDDRVTEERSALVEAATHLEDTATRLEARGYEVYRIPTEPERARRFQSYTNVIPSRDRLIVPIYPSIDRVHGWTVPGEDGRDQVDVDLGFRDSTFALEGGNLAAVELYRKLHADVRIVRDYFYLASGNAHCVIGRLS